MTKGVIGQTAANLMYQTANESQTSSNKAESNSFQNLLMNIGKSIKSTGSIQLKEYSKSEVQVSQKTTTNQFRKKSFEAQQNTNTISENRSVSSKDTSKNIDTITNEETNDLDENKLQKAKDLLDKIVSTICKTLDITDEELIKRMEIMGITVVNLTDASVLKQLVLLNAGTDDPAYLLTNEDAADAFTEICKQIEELKLQAGILNEELDEMLNSSEFSDYMKSFETDTEQLTKSDIVPENVESKSIEFKVIRIDDEGNEQHSDSGKKQGFEKSTDAQISQGQSFINKAAEFSTINENALSQTEYSNQLQDIASQILEQIKITIRPAQTSMELTLNPENLGKVNLNVISKDGILTAHFTTQNQIAKEAIESNIQFLRESLESQGIKVEKIEVALSEYTFQKESNADTNREQERHQSGRKKLRINSSNVLKDSSSIEEQENIVLQDRGLNIDYTA